MILVDTGPLVALFDPRDSEHLRMKEALRGIDDHLLTTAPVLTEAFHLLDPGSLGCRNLSTFLRAGGLSFWPLSEETVQRSLDLMEKYRDHPMDFADASLVVAAECLGTRRIFTLDRRDFLAYRMQRGRRSVAFDLVP